MVGYIYKITSPSGRVYIGQTINITRRKWQYKAGKFQTQTKLKRSIDKYGWDSHLFEVIEEVPTHNLDNREIEYIKNFDCVNSGLNCLLGGKNGKRGVPNSPETRLKISQALKGKSRSKGYKHRTECNVAKSIRLSKSIIHVETGIVYNSIKDAAQALGLSQGNICWVCQGKLPHTKNNTFQYINQN